MSVVERVALLVWCLLAGATVLVLLERVLAFGVEGRFGWAFASLGLMTVAMIGFDLGVRAFTGGE